MSAHEPKSSEPQPSLLQRWLREPLLHFLLIGLALFVVSSARRPNPSAQPDSQRIVLTEDDLLQMTVAWRAQGRPTPRLVKKLQRTVLAMFTGQP